MMLHTKKHANFVDALIKELREAASIYDDRTFSEDERREHKWIHLVAENKLKEYEKEDSGEYYTEKNHLCTQRIQLHIKNIYLYIEMVL